jgi:hypothetical protein
MDRMTHLILDESERPRREGNIRYIHRAECIAGTRLCSFRISNLSRPLTDRDIQWISESVLTHLMPSP